MAVNPGAVTPSRPNDDHVQVAVAVGVDGLDEHDAADRRPAPAQVARAASRA